MAYGFKRFVLVSLGIMLLGAALIYGLKAGLPSESQTEEPIIVERVFDEWGLKLTMSVGKTVYAFEEPVNVTLTLTNIGNETVKYSYGSDGWRFDFVVCNGPYFNDSYVVYQWRTGKGFMTWAEPITLNPGDSVSSTLQWSYNEKRAQGTYYIFGMTGHIGDIERGSKHVSPLGFLCIETEHIDVTILSP